MSNIIIRNSRESDASDVHRLLEIIGDLHRNGRPDMYPNLKSKYTLEEVRKRLSSPENGVFVADLQGKTVGYVFCDIIKEGDGLTLYVDDLCVDPQCRKQGIGKSLLDYAANYGKANNCRYLMLNVWEFNSDAVKFYENYGFKTRSRHMEISI